MHRSSLLTLLNNYSPKALEEITYKKTMIFFIEANPRCFERSLEQGHITSSSWLLSNDESKALLMHHNKLNVWVQLGGHCDGDSDVLQVALKEAQEESGIEDIVPVVKEIFDIDIHLIPANSHEKEHYHYDVRFLLRVTGDKEFVQNSESKELRWIEKKKSSLPTQELSVVRMFNKWLER